MVKLLPTLRTWVRRPGAIADDAKALPAPTPCNWLGPTTFAKRPEQFMGVPMFYTTEYLYPLFLPVIEGI